MSLKNNNIKLYFILFTLLGFILRIWISQFGSNFDFAVWQGSLEFFRENKSIYEYGNYAYSPVWINILNILDLLKIPFLEESFLANKIPGSSYRIKIILFLSLVDSFIFYLLYKNYSLKVGLLFFLNPISIIITGHHNQFSALALLIGFLAILLYEKNRSKNQIILPLILLGLSISAKHILIYFPIWWAIKEKKIVNKFLILFVPYSIFILSFLPFLPGDFENIISRLLFEWKRADGPFWGMFGPKIVHMYFSLQTLFSFILIFLGFVFENKKLRESFFLYTIAVVAFSSMMYTQYLMIPLIALAVFWNWKYFLYSLLAFLLFLVDGDQLNITILREQLDWNLRSTRIAHYPIILILLIGFVENSVGKKNFNLFISKIFKYIKNKVKSQFNFK